MSNSLLSVVALLMVLTTATAQVSVHLSGGPGRHEGRIEVYYNGTWGTVCRHSFDDRDARVVCYMLGYGHTGRSIGNRYGAGSGRIWLDDVQCRGTETNIADCGHRVWGNHNCRHYDDVSVSCPPVRLVGGRSPREGRLEVDYNGTWGTVCDHSFDDTDARVVCYMLGHERNGRFTGNLYGAGSGQIWLDNVQCNGTESSIADCRHNGWGVHNCEHSKDVSVSCPPVTVRLVGGGSPREGRLEVNYQGTWGTVCYDSFYYTEARVVCYMLGYGCRGWSIGNRYGAGNGQIWLDNVQCSGMETNIANCRSHGWGIHNCGHHQDVSVSCPPVTVRLVGGGSPQDGRLEVNYNGTWGTVCRAGFNDAAASVVCYMLGYGSSGWVIGNRYGAGTGLIWLDNVQCNGTETSIADCQHSGWGSHNCGHDEDVSVSCLSYLSVRLVGSGNPQEGLLEVYYNGSWGTVCHDHFNNAAAGVVCHTLGYGHGGQFISNRYGVGSGKIWLDDVQCNGTETSIADCQHSGWGNHNCGHGEDVSVSCIIVRLVEGPNPQEGRLEVRYKGSWGTVCDDHFNNAAASVVCNMLGYKRTGQFIGSHYGASNGTIWLDDIRCDGTERHISECSHGRWGNHNCGHNEDVAVSCINDSSTIGTTILTSSPDIVSLSRMSNTSPSTHSGSTNDTTQIVITVVIVLGLIVCVIIIGLFFYMYFRQKLSQERTEVSMIPMPVIASTNGHNNDAFDDTAKYEDSADNAQASENNAYSKF